MTERIFFKLLLCIVSYLFVACSSSENVFTRVEQYYADDSLKQESAKYLGMYSSYHNGVTRHLTDSLGNAINDIDRSTFASDTAFFEYLGNHKYKFLSRDTLSDVASLSDSFLIENIELAFDSWHKPWARDVNFSDFCKYILPYRNADEELSNWRSVLKNRYEPSIVDSVQDVTSMKEVSEYIMREVRRDFYYTTKSRDLYDNFLTLDEMDSLGGGECRACAHYAALALRACGIPCTMIEIHWRFTECPHTTVMIPAIGSNDKSFRISVGDTLIYMGEPKDTMAAWRVWAYSYEPNLDLMKLSEDKRISDEFVCPLTRQDITDAMCRTYDFSLPVEHGSDDNLFLCRFHNWQWYAIREGQVKGDSVYFRNATIRQWYRLGRMKGDEIEPFGETFTILGNGDVRKYDLTGDSVLFKIAYSCDPDEDRLIRKKTTYQWDKVGWKPYTDDALLWGFNQKTGEYRVFEEKYRKDFVPVFHLLKIKSPCWTVFFDDELPRPLGFIVKDPTSGEGYFMQF